MKTIYTVEEYYDYGESNVLKVFESLQDAEAFVKNEQRFVLHKPVKGAERHWRDGSSGVMIVDYQVVPKSQ